MHKLIPLLFLTQAVFAEPGATNSQPSSTSTTKTQLLASERAVAETWGLDVEEWQRYRHLQQGIRGSISPSTLSPIEVLGIHARDAAERRHYAELWARAMHDDAERVLAFQHAYDAAFKRLYSNQPMIDLAKLANQEVPPARFGAADRLILITSLNCPSCDTVFEKLRTHIDKVEGIDVFVVGEGAELAAIRDWVRTNNINASWLRSRRLTVNKGTEGIELAGGVPTPPAIYRLTNGSIEQVAYAEL